MELGIFLTVKDMQILRGTETYNAANKIHLKLRKEMGKKGKHITIKEYCDYMEIDFDYVWSYLRTPTKHHS
jgi:hypothetical protein